MISEQVRKMTQVHWIMLFLVISIAWIFLYLLSVPNELRLLSKIYGANFFNEFCIITPDVSGFFQIFSMWILMSAAMMAPTALPAFAVYEELGDNVEINLLRLLLGYLTVWIILDRFRTFFAFSRRRCREFVFGINIDGLIKFKKDFRFVFLSFLRTL